MTPERWRQVTAVFHAARDCEPDARGALLDRLCSQDASLRAEVDALLGAEAAAGRFGDRPLSVEVLPQLSPGMAFGQYRVEELIGAGGMGQVYRATDTRLRRTVALKLLMPELSSDPDFGSRFEREARALASLNHANIGAIYGLEEAEGVHALVLEFVEGPTLAERLVQGSLPIPEALIIARQIASALEAAHARGIVHRDLKPANIKLKGARGPIPARPPDGRLDPVFSAADVAGCAVKVLDFGIARMSPDGRDAATTAAATRAGAIIGTPAYMSPEQARGLPVDKRTDIWAFGCVLFEMLTGRGPFAGETASDSLAKVIEREPDWHALPAGVPESIRRLIRRCLQKEPANRLHDIADARIEIAETLSAPARPDDERAPVSARTGVILATLAIAALFLLAAAIWWRPLFPPSPSLPPAQAMEFGVTFPNNFMPADGVAVSPDGRQIAANVWSNHGDIWVVSLDGSQPRPLPGGEGASYPFWSPDSATIGFFKNSQLLTVGAAGGPLTSIARIASGVSGGSWNRDGVILVAAGGKLFRVSALGGSTPVEVPIAGVAGEIKYPTFHPDGRHFVVCVEQHGRGSVDLGSLDGDPVKVLGESECSGGFAPPDHVLFLRGASLLAQKLDLGRLVLEGEAQVVASSVTRGAVGPWPELTLSASDTGVLVFPAPRGGAGVGQLTWFNRDGKVTGTIERPAGDGEYLNPEISPDGTIVAANRADPQTGGWHVWLIDVARGNTVSRLTTGPASDFDPVWSFDGKEIVYASDREGHLAFYRQSIVGGPATQVKDVSQVRFPIPSDWTQDGHILYQRLQQSVWAFLLVDAQAEIQVSPRDSSSYGGRLSPDGKWLAYASAQPGSFNVFVERFPGGSPRKQISNGGGVHPRWTNGKEIVYWVPPGGIKSTELSLTDQDIRVGTTQTLVSQPVLNLIDARTHYDITRDGQRILARQPAGPPSPGIRVIVNWMAKLK